MLNALHIFFPIINYLEFGVCVYQQYVLINYVK
jgi:hypothetical protein